MMARLAPAVAALIVVCLIGDHPRASQGVVSIYVEPPSPWASGGEYALAIDDAPVPIANVIRGPQALSAIALFDVSNSVRPLPFEGTARHLAGFAHAGDTLRLATFADRIFIGTTPVTDRRSVTIGAREVAQPAGASPLWDAIERSVEALHDAPGLRAIVVFSDGLATGNDHGLDEVRESVQRSGVIVSVVGLADEALRFQSQMRIIGRNEGLRRIARETAGDYRELKKADDVPQYLMRSLLENLRGRIRLEFVPPVRDGAMHRLTVTRGGQPVAAPARVQF